MNGNFIKFLLDEIKWLQMERHSFEYIKLLVSSQIIIISNDVKNSVERANLPLFNFKSIANYLILFY